MTDRFEMAEHLVRNAREQLPKLKEAYANCLDSRIVSADLQIEIGHVLSDLRSGLDYCARELHDSLSVTARASKVYFPIAKKGASPCDFLSLVGSCIPGLAKSRPDLVILLSSFQAFSSQDNDWLPILATLRNEQAHVQWSPQTGREIRQRYTQAPANEVTVSRPTFEPAISPGYQLTGGIVPALSTGLSPWPGVLRVEDKVLVPNHDAGISGECSDSEHTASEHTASAVDVTWVSFEFSAVGQPVFPFLARAVDGVERVVQALKAKV